MSRFADRAAVKRLVLGPCACEDTPHDEDWIDIKVDLSAADQLALDTAEPTHRLTILATAWNLLDGGEIAAIDAEHTERLYLDEFEKLNEFLTANAKVRAVPNASAAPSRGSSRASGSRTPKAKTGDSSTTPS